MTKIDIQALRQEQEALKQQKQTKLINKIVKHFSVAKWSRNFATCLTNYPASNNFEFSLTPTSLISQFQLHHFVDSNENQKDFAKELISALHQEIDHNVTNFGEFDYTLSVQPYVIKISHEGSNVYKINPYKSPLRAVKLTLTTYIYPKEDWALA
jgi:hypothetical protein